MQGLTVKYWVMKRYKKTIQTRAGLDGFCWGLLLGYEKHVTQPTRLRYYVQLLGRNFATNMASPTQAQVTEALFSVGVIVIVPPCTNELGAVASIVAVITPSSSTAVTLAYLPVGYCGFGAVAYAAVQDPLF